MNRYKFKISRVVSVTDGDTFRVDIDEWPRLFGWHMPVRLRRVNCPERQNKDGSPNPLAEKAREFSFAKLTSGKEIILLNAGRDKYFRILADVVIDGRDLASDLLLNGLAVIYKQ